MERRFYVKYPIISSCPLRCPFCVNSKERKNWEKDLSKDELKVLADYLNRNPIIGVTVTGGEPFSSPNLLSFCSELSVPFGIITSGTVGRDEVLPQLFKLPNLSFITISIDCLDKAAVQGIRGKDVLDEQLRFLDRMIELNHERPVKVRININTVLTKLNKDYLIQSIEEHIKKDIDKVYILRMRPSGTEADANIMLQSEEYEEFTVNLYKRLADVDENAWNKTVIRYLPVCASSYYKDKYHIRMNVKNDQCGMNRNTIYLNNRAEISNCGCLHGKYPRTRLVDTDLDKLYIEQYQPVRQVLKAPLKSYVTCSKCPHYQLDCFPCIRFNQEDAEIIFEECEYYLNNEYKR